MSEKETNREGEACEEGCVCNGDCGLVDDIKRAIAEAIRKAYE